MQVIQKTKQWLKIKRWQLRRLQATRRWGREQLMSSPKVLGNAMPKSGSHLIYQVVQGLCQLGAYVNPGFPPVNRDEFNEKLPDDQIMTNLLRLQPGDTAYGYLKARLPFLPLLTQEGWATIFVFRDPRDMIISHVFYATQMHTGHGMHSYYTTVLNSMQERINAAIEGVEEPGSELSPIDKKYHGYLGWLDETSVLCLRFEDFILQRQKALGSLLDYLEERGFSPSLSRKQGIEILQASIKPHKSGTYRTGQTGGWREHFSEANKMRFKALTGDLLFRLGYESDDAW